MTITYESPERHPWMKQGHCIDSVTDYWFPAGSNPHATNDLEREAVAICKTCPVAVECLDYALSLGPTVQGVWGATTEADRRQLLREISNTNRRARRNA